MSDYEVGYGKPPRKSQFKPGQSGNPKGRPRGRKSFSTILVAELSERLIVKEGGKTRRMTKMEAVVKQLVSKALKGDPRTLAELLRQIKMHLPDETGDDAHALPASESDLALLEDLIRRSTRKNAGGDHADRGE
ncbi:MULTISPECIES: DUF5681 domain-containing protein [Hyphobacterium]|uniref:DUF5681 domain-containing protein n=1 Tax=Hyphobacterium vulgare TaxID=1736751 RepID=A0ABV6ZVJ9_9PROT